MIGNMYTINVNDLNKLLLFSIKDKHFIFNVNDNMGYHVKDWYFNKTLFEHAKYHRIEYVKVIDSNDYVSKSLKYDYCTRYCKLVPNEFAYAIDRMIDLKERTI